MFDTLSNALTGAFDKLRGQGKLSEANIKEGMREIRRALLEADVNFKVVKDFLKTVEEKAVGEEVIKSVKPGQMIVKIVYDELTALMGPVDHSIKNNPKGPTIVMLCGLQGSGKTTTCGKLAMHFRSKGRKPMMVAADLQRPAAIEQLRVIGRQLDIPVYAEDGGRAVKVCERGIAEAAKNACDLVILDTAGRLHIDAELMAELKTIQGSLKPQQVLLVVDSMVGQDAVNSASEFNAQLEIDGVILTKLDGDARGGAALSVKAVTGKPIKYIGVGEKFNKLELFHPDRMASRILGMGDIVSLVEQAQENVTEEEALALAKKMKKRQFNLEDFLDQMGKMNKMGGFTKLMKLLPKNMIPGMNLGDINAEQMAQAESELVKKKAIIQSMTAVERRNPNIISGSRRRRIAIGCGQPVSNVNSLLKEFREMQKMMSKFGGGMGGFGGLFGR